MWAVAVESACAGPGSLFGSVLERKVGEEVARNPRFCGVLFVEQSEAAASGIRRRNLVPGSLRVA